MKRFLILFLLCACIGPAVFAQADLQPVATINLIKSEPITVRQLKNEIEKLAWKELAPRLNRVPTTEEIARATQNLNVEQRRQVLDAMINERLVIQAAERDRVTVTDNELNQVIQRLKTQMAQAAGRQPTDNEFAVAIKNETGQDFPAFRDQLRRQGIIEKYLDSKKGAQLRSIQEPTEAEILNHYNLTKSNFVRPDTVRVSMIEVLYGPDNASKIRAKDQIDRLNREISSNTARFDEAVIKGQAPNAGYKSGDAGYLPRNMQAQQLVGAEFLNTAFTLKQGEVSRVIESAQAYHIIKVTETYSQKALELDEIFRLQERMTVRDYIKLSLGGEKQQEALRRATQELITELRTGNPFRITESALNW